MEYLLGRREEFFSFLNQIGEEDKVAILTHTDLDGIASGIFLQKILEAKTKNFTHIKFVDYGINLLDEVAYEFEEEGITKVFISDFAADRSPEFSEFREKFGTFLIDHHILNPEIKDDSNIIKGATEDCAAFLVYDLGKGLIDEDAWHWLVCSAIFTDFSYKKEEHLKFIQRYYPEVNMENISSSTPGLNGRKISNALIYYKNDISRVYELVLSGELDKLTEAHDIVEEEINKYVEEFGEKAEFYPERNLYWYEIDPRFNIASIVTTLISKIKPDISFLTVSTYEDMFKISARNQNQTEDMNLLMKKGIEGLSRATGGGHPPASAAKIRRDDLEKFKENILKV